MNRLPSPRKAFSKASQSGNVNRELRKTGGETLPRKASSSPPAAAGSLTFASRLALALGFAGLGRLGARPVLLDQRHLVDEQLERLAGAHLDLEVDDVVER